MISFTGIAMVMFLEVLGIFLNSTFFWVFSLILYFFAMLLLSSVLYQAGKWSLSHMTIVLLIKVSTFQEFDKLQRSFLYITNSFLVELLSNLSVKKTHFNKFFLQSFAGKARSCNFFPNQISKKRAIFIIVLDLINVAFILLGALNPPGISTYLLMIFIGNLIFYFVYYAIMKVVKKEKIPPIAYAISIIAIGEISLNFKVKTYFNPSLLQLQLHRKQGGS